MSSGDSTCGADADKYGSSNQQTATVSQSLNDGESWSGPQYRGETRVWTHDNGTLVEVSASAAGASHRDELVWSVIVRPDSHSTGRRITQSYLSTEQGAVERAVRYVAEHPDGSLPTSSWDEWGVEQ